MSIKVPLEVLGDAVGGMADTCFLLTTNGDSTPHPAHVAVDFDGETLIVSVGRRSWDNAGERTSVTLLWPASPSSWPPEGTAALAEGTDDGPMSLLVDGDASHAEPADQGGGTVRVRPTSAIWHRRPGQPPA